MRPLACVVLLLLAVPARADLLICVPFVTVRIARMAPPGMPGPTAVSVRAPFVNLNFASRPSLPATLPPAPRPVVPSAPARPGDPPPVPGEEMAPSPRPVTPAPPAAATAVPAWAISLPVSGRRRAITKWCYATR